MRVLFANIRDVRFNPIPFAQVQQKNLTYARVKKDSMRKRHPQREASHSLFPTGKNFPRKVDACVDLKTRPA